MTGILTPRETAIEHFGHFYAVAAHFPSPTYENDKSQGPLWVNIFSNAFESKYVDDGWHEISLGKPDRYIVKEFLGTPESSHETNSDNQSNLLLSPGARMFKSAEKALNAETVLTLVPELPELSVIEPLPDLLNLANIAAFKVGAKVYCVSHKPMSIIEATIREAELRNTEYFPNIEPSAFGYQMEVKIKVEPGPFEVLNRTSYRLKLGENGEIPEWKYASQSTEFPKRDDPRMAMQLFTSREDAETYARNRALRIFAEIQGFLPAGVA